ncbi:MAG TPA: hypothetical protein VGL50_05595 [Steroidobacteraceae bacterium]|jgi:hypothetical protein
MYQRPSQPAQIGSVVDDAVKLYRASFRRCAPIAVLGALISAALDVFVVAFAHHEGMPFNSLEASLLVYQQPPVVALGILQSVLLLGIMGSLLVMQNAVVTGDLGMTVAQAMAVGFTRLGRFVMGTLVYLAVTLLGCLIIIPGIYIGNAWSLYPAAVYVDDAGGIQSLEASRQLTVGNWWHAATVLGVAFAAVLIVAMLSDFAAGMLELAGNPGGAAVQSAMQLVGDIADVFLLPMVPAALLALYNDLKLRRRAVR